MNISSNSKIRVISATKYTREIAITTPTGGINRYGKEKLISETIHQIKVGDNFVTKSRV